MRYNQSNTEKFTIKSSIKHNNKYDYSKVSYINNRTKVCIVCPTHGEFWQTPNNHYIFGCYECGHINRQNKRFLSNDIFIKKSNTIHNNVYDYSKINYKNTKIKVIIICSIHGEFTQTPNSHLSGQGCPKCKTSKGEKEIINILNENKIIFEYQKKFDNCKYKRKLIFDFYLPNHNICIEYDGEGHFKPIRYNGMNEKVSIDKFESLKIKDDIKNNFCNTNNIHLIRINSIECIKNIILEIIQTF